MNRNSPPPWAMPVCWSRAVTESGSRGAAGSLRHPPPAMTTRMKRSSSGLPRRRTNDHSVASRRFASSYSLSSRCNARCAGINALASSGSIGVAPGGYSKIIARVGSAAPPEASGAAPRSRARDARRSSSEPPHPPAPNRVSITSLNVSSATSAPPRGPNRPGGHLRIPSTGLLLAPCFTPRIDTRPG